MLEHLFWTVVIDLFVVGGYYTYVSWKGGDLAKLRDPFYIKKSKLP